MFSPIKHSLRSNTISLIGAPMNFLVFSFMWPCLGVIENQDQFNRKLVNGA